MMLEFDVGDSVTIVDEPYRECPFKWTEAMDRFCSQDSSIVAKEWSISYETYCYKIAADYGVHAWCAGCFKQNDSSDFETASDEEISDLLGIWR